MKVSPTSINRIQPLELKCVHIHQEILENVWTLFGVLAEVSWENAIGKCGILGEYFTAECDMCLIHCEK